MLYGIDPSSSQFVDQVMRARASAYLIFGGIVATTFDRVTHTTRSSLRLCNAFGEGASFIRLLLLAVNVPLQLPRKKTRKNECPSSNVVLHIFGEVRSCHHGCRCRCSCLVAACLVLRPRAS